jgi:hypothetical protein
LLDEVILSGSKWGLSLIWWISVVFGLVLIVIIVWVEIIHVLVHLRSLFVGVVGWFMPGVDFIALVLRHQVVHDFIG